MNVIIIVIIYLFIYFLPLINTAAGIVRTALPSMDREARDQYLLVIQAKDMGGQMGGLSGTTTVTVTLTDVNDNPPRFSRSTALASHLSYTAMCSPFRVLDKLKNL